LSSTVVFERPKTIVDEFLKGVKAEIDDVSASMTERPNLNKPLPLITPKLTRRRHRDVMEVVQDARTWVEHRPQHREKEVEQVQNATAAVQRVVPKAQDLKKARPNRRPKSRFGAQKVHMKHWLSSPALVEHARYQM
jgi:hypothetical protein